MDLFDVVTSNASTHAVEFNKLWRNNMGGYLPMACAQFPNVRVGGIVSTVSPDNERVLAVVTPFGNVVAVEVDRASRFIVVHTTPELQGIWGKGNLTEDQVEALLGVWGKDNIGIVLGKLISYDKRRVA